jgi:hypothetical protein
MMMICLLDSQVYIYVCMVICPALNAFMHVYMRQLIFKKKEEVKTNEIYENMQEAH